MRRHQGKYSCVGPKEGLYPCRLFRLDTPALEDLVHNAPAHASEAAGSEAAGSEEFAVIIKDTLAHARYHLPLWTWELSCLNVYLPGQYKGRVLDWTLPCCPCRGAGQLRLPLL